MINLFEEFNVARGLIYPYRIKKYIPIIKKFVAEGGDVRADLDAEGPTLLFIIAFREITNRKNSRFDEHNTALFCYLIENFKFTLNPFEQFYIFGNVEVRDMFNQAQAELEKRILLENVDIRGLRELDDNRM